MKKLTLARRLVASILAAMTLASTTAAFAETVVYEDSFETSNGATTGLYVSMPEIRTYGENCLPTKWEQENIYEGKESSDTTATTVSKLSTYNGTYTSDSKVAHGGEGDYCAKFTPSAANKLWNAYPFYMVQANVLEAGIYEIEGWFYTDIDGLRLDICTDTNQSNSFDTAFASFSPFGNEKGTTTLKANEWTYAKATYSIPAKNTAAFRIAFLTNTWTRADGQTGVLYLDDVKLRKVTNATISTETMQAGMPVYSTSAISGQTATARVFAANTTNDDKTLQLISAVYDADGRYVSAIVNKPIRVPANSSKAPYTVDFEVPVLEEGQYIKSFTWDSIANPVALGLVKNYTDADYILSANMARNAVIPNTKGKWAVQDTSGAGSIHGTTRVVNGVAKTGVSSLLVSTFNDNSRKQNTFTNFPVTAGHKYKIEYYCNWRSIIYGATDYTPGYIRNGINAGGSAVTPTAISYDGKTATVTAPILHPTAADTQKSTNVLIAGEWIKVEIEFEVPTTNTEKYWCYLFANNKTVQGGAKCQEQMYIDDFKVTDITN